MSKEEKTYHEICGPIDPNQFVSWLNQAVKTCIYGNSYKIKKANNYSDVKESLLKHYGIKISNKEGFEKIYLKGVFK